MVRIGQRRFKPLTSQSRHLDVVHKTETIEDSAALAPGEDTIFSMTTASSKGVPILVQEDISLFQTSILEANLIPNGSNITTSNYQIIGPWREQVDGDEKNIVSKIYVRNADAATTDLQLSVPSNFDNGYWAGEWIEDPAGSVGIGKNALGGDVYAAWRFTSVTIPQGETINTATITLTASETKVDSRVTLFYGIDEDNTDDYYPDAADPGGRDKTTANIAWNQSGETLDQEYTSPDISTLIKEIVDRGGWSSGNALGIITADNGSSNDNILRYYSYDGDSAKVAVLNVNYGTGSSKTVLFRGRTRYITPRRDVTIT